MSADTCTVICYMITMICFFIVGMIMLILGAMARSSRDVNAPLGAVANGSGWQYFFALSGVCVCVCLFALALTSRARALFLSLFLPVILLFTSIIGAAAAFSFWRMLRQEDEGGDKYVYLAGTQTPRRTGKGRAFGLMAFFFVLQRPLTETRKPHAFLARGARAGLTHAG